jgi:hypothetical protein
MHPLFAAALALAPLRGAWLEKITLEDGSEASVTLPLGATEPRPVVIGIHGSGDRPEWSCGEWRGVVDSYAFVVCPEGTPSGNAFVWQSTEQLEKRVLSALAAAQAKYAPYMMDGPIVLAGFSQGAGALDVLDAELRCRLRAEPADAEAERHRRARRAARAVRAHGERRRDRRDQTAVSVARARRPALGAVAQ